MSNKKGNKNVHPELPECPVCYEIMTIPIYQCQTGHSLCDKCTQNIQRSSTPGCPMCRNPMTQIRNLALEGLVANAKFPCPNKSQGCVYMKTRDELDEHVKECIFRNLDCPLGVALGKCSWKGNFKEMSAHFQERHSNQWLKNLDVDVELKNLNLNEDDRFLYLFSQDNFLFIMNVKIDNLQKIAYWTIQHIGSKNMAQQFVYEIHVTSLQNQKRKFVYTESCYNDNLKADDIFRMGKCPIISLECLKHFLKDKKLTFRFSVRRAGPPPPKNRVQNEAGSGFQNQHRGEFKKNQGKGRRPFPAQALRGSKHNLSNI